MCHAAECPKGASGSGVRVRTGPGGGGGRGYPQSYWGRLRRPRGMRRTRGAVRWTARCGAGMQLRTWYLPVGRSPRIAGVTDPGLCASAHHRPSHVPMCTHPPTCSPTRPSHVYTRTHTLTGRYPAAAGDRRTGAAAAQPSGESWRTGGTNECQVVGLGRGVGLAAWWRGSRVLGGCMERRGAAWPGRPGVREPFKRKEKSDWEGQQ